MGMRGSSWMEGSEAARVDVVGMLKATTRGE